MNTYIIEEWIETYHDIKEIEADSIDCNFGRNVLMKNGKIIASIAGSKSVYLKQ